MKSRGNEIPVARTGLISLHLSLRHKERKQVVIRELHSNTTFFFKCMPQGQEGVATEGEMEL